eukprot:3703995-Prymnesium_polylepis.1
MCKSALATTTFANVSGERESDACVYRAAAAAAPRARGHVVGRDGRRLMGRPEVDHTPESQCR